jgi:hypothetical protein
VAAEQVIQAFVEHASAPDDPSLSVEGDALMVDRWWPAALWLGAATCLVRLDEGPGPFPHEALAMGLTGAGLEVLGLDLDAPIEAVTAHLLGLVGGRWQVWATSEAAGRADVAAAAA